MGSSPIHPCELLRPKPDQLTPLGTKPVGEEASRLTTHAISGTIREVPQIDRDRGHVFKWHFNWISVDALPVEALFHPVEPGAIERALFTHPVVVADMNLLLRIGIHIARKALDMRQVIEFYSRN